MSRGFVKIYGDLLLGSSLMDEAVETRWLFMCFAAAADKDGFVRCQTVGVAARLANIREDQAARALEALSSPDPNSSSREEGGRRIVRVDGGWKLVNHAKYREMRTVKQVKNAERQKKWRSAHPLRVTHVDSMSHEVSASASVSVEGGMGGDPLPPALPPADRAERAIRQATEALRSRLYALISEMTDEDPKHRDPTELMRLVTAYDKVDGTRVKGVINAHLLTHERVERSIADAEAILADWRRTRGSGPRPAVQP